MGAVIGGTAWLLDLRKKGPYPERIAERILRAEIATRLRTGHVLDLVAKDVRSEITHSASYGRVADVSVACRLCGCSAALTEWVRWARASSSFQQTVARVGSVSSRPQDFLHIQPCPIARACHK